MDEERILEIAAENLNCEPDQLLTVIEKFKKEIKEIDSKIKSLK